MDKDTNNRPPMGYSRDYRPDTVGCHDLPDEYHNPGYGPPKLTEAEPAPPGQYRQSKRQQNTGSC